jgi:transcriptional regulator, AraC family
MTTKTFTSLEAPIADICRLSSKPDGFEMISLPKSDYLMFQGEPFDEEDYVAAINEIWEAEKRYDPTLVGLEWDDLSPRIQLEPRGERGYIELVPVKPKKI